MATSRKNTTRPEVGSPEWRQQMGAHANGVPLDEGDDEAPPPDMPGGDLVSLEDEFEETPQDRVARLLSNQSTDDRASLKVYRVTGPNKYAFCEDMSPADFESRGYTGIRKRWGAGTYQLRLYGVHPQSRRFGVLAKENVDIAEALDETATTPTAAPSAMGGEMASLLRTIAEGQQAMMQAIVNRPQVDPMEQLKQTIGLVTLINQAGGGGQKQPGNSIAEMVANFKAIKEMAGEFGGGGGGDGDSLLSLAKPIVEMVSAAQRQQVVAPAVHAPIMVPQRFAQPPQPMPVAHPAGVPEHDAHDMPDNEHVGNMPEEDEDPMSAFQMAKLPLTLKTLRGLAAKGDATVEQGAEFAYEELPDLVLDALQKDDWFEALQMVAPDAVSYKPWLEKVRALILQYMREDAQGFEEGAQNPGHIGNPP